MPPNTPIKVTRSDGAIALSTLLRRELVLSWGAAKQLCSRGKVRVDGVVRTEPGLRLARGNIVEVFPDAPAATREGGPVVLERVRLLHLDPHVVVIDKPPGIDSVPYEPGTRGTLVDRLAVALHRWDMAPAHAPLFVVQRLDRDTTGVMVFGRTWLAKRHLAGLFREHTIDREYVALVHGRLVGERTFDTVLLEDRGDGLRGSAKTPAPDHVGRRAITQVTPLGVTGNEGGATLVRCTLETGRQHQIRIHLAEAGHPVIGDRVYIRDLRGPKIEAPRVMLHAMVLGFEHPLRERGEMRFEAEAPGDFVGVAKRLGLDGSLP